MSTLKGKSSHRLSRKDVARQCFWVTAVNLVAGEDGDTVREREDTKHKKREVEKEK